jgi:hypothetical protein
MRKFYDLLESQSSSMYEISIAIIGCGRFAAPTRLFMGSWELKRLLVKLFQFSDRLSSGYDFVKQKITFTVKSKVILQII